MLEPAIMERVPSTTSCFLGVDLGSTTSKAILLGEDGVIVGRGLTNTRSNYLVAVDVARSAALVSARFGLLSRALAADARTAGQADALCALLDRAFRHEQHLEALDRLARHADEEASSPRHGPSGSALRACTLGILAEVRRRHETAPPAGIADASQFFRDLAAAEYLPMADAESRSRGIAFEALMGVFDKAILRVENEIGDRPFADAIGRVLARIAADLDAHGTEVREAVSAAVSAAARAEIGLRGTAGTGYGRQRLPFRKEQIRSEILCHGLGAHHMFPGTRTVLDIGGQDTKAIQLDEAGLVKTFQMNDRCAAGCGRYLGYVADELNLGLHELGPLALSSRHPTRINSTCTVFAGAELRDRLSLGETREDILSGLHRAIVLRAMALLARSGGVNDEFTFTGGVAKNQAVVKSLEDLVAEHYGPRTLRIAADSIYTGALGAALFARQAAAEGMAA